jgi:hypothetical protein
MYTTPDFQNQQAATDLQRSSISWRAIFAGAFISLLFYVILTALGIAIGGAKLQGVVAGTSGGGGLTLASGLWLGISVLISLFAGCYLAGRASGLMPSRIGGIQGLVIAALFFGFLFMQVGSVIGSLGSGLGSVVGTVGNAAGGMAGNPQVQAVVQDRLGDLNLKSPPDQVAQGVASRLIRGDTQGAKNYLASQAGVSRAEVNRRVDQFNTDVQNTLKDIGTKTAKAASLAGWSLFGIVLVGSIFSYLGGLVGVGATLGRPMSRRDELRVRRTRAA